VFGEGFSDEAGLGKIVVLRKGVSQHVPYPQDDILALVSDFDIEAEKPTFKPDDVSGIADFIEQLLVQGSGEENLVTLIINEKSVPLNAFVQGILKNVILGVVATLRRQDKELKQIEVVIKNAGEAKDIPLN